MAMRQNGTHRRDVTHLFAEGSKKEPENNEGTEPDTPSDDGVGSVPLIDPFGLLEELSEGKVHDPVRHGVIKCVNDIRSYFDSSGNQP